MSSKKILIVEDDPDLLNLLEIRLKQEGFATISTSVGSEALEMVKRDDVSLVILDILLPDIDGLSILHEISNDPKTRNLPVLIFSNLADQGSFDQVSAIGKYEYLVKAQTDLKTLVDKIREMLNRMLML